MNDRNGETVVDAAGVSKVYWDGQRKLSILTRISFTARRGEAVAILGPSGSGKTTLLNVLSGLDAPSEGEVRLAGRRLRDLGEEGRARLRNAALGFVFQFYHLLPELTALENVMLPAMMSAESARRRLARPRAQELLRRVGLAARVTHYPSELSGGEQQRVAIARSLVNDPQILFCDEPTGNLDPRTGLEIAEILREFFFGTDRTALWVTHDERIAKMAHRVVRMEELNKQNNQWP